MIANDATKVILFRADGSTAMGLGHLYRTTALAEMLSHKYECILVSTGLPGNLKSQFQPTYSSFWQMDADDLEQEVEVLREKVAQLGAGELTIVLDGYHFNGGYQIKLKELGYRLVCIDDIHATHFYADVVINHAPIKGLAARYSTEDYTNLALGTDFALLRNAYRQAARTLQLKVGHQRKLLGNFFLCFGGADPLNRTSWLIEELTRLGYRQTLDVVLGPANAGHEAVNRAVVSYPGDVNMFESLHDDEMIGCYRKAAVAFLPSSTIMLEALALGVTVIGGYYVDNQVEIYRGFVARGLIEGVGDWNNPSGLESAIEASLKPTPTAGPKTSIDAYSSLNLTAIFDQLHCGREVLIGRLARPGDSRQYFTWANDTTVRNRAIDQNPIPWQSHQDWFSSKLADQGCIMIHYSYLNQPCGQLRYDLDGNTAVISFSVDIGFRGKGFGKAIVALAEDQLKGRAPGVEYIVALVKEDNPASKKTFLRNGFTLSGKVTKRGVELLNFVKTIK